MFVFKRALLFEISSYKIIKHTEINLKQAYHTSKKLLFEINNNKFQISKRFKSSFGGNRNTPINNSFNSYTENVLSRSDRLKYFFKYSIFTVGFTGFCYSASIIINYERAKTMKKKPLRHFESSKYGDLRKKLNDFWNNQSNVNKAALCIAFSNLIILLAWRSRQLDLFLSNNFLLNPTSGKVRQLIFSSFSHTNFFHFFFNMAALYSLSNLVSQILPVEQFVAFYLSSAVFSSFLGNSVRLLLSGSNQFRSLGAVNSNY